MPKVRESLEQMDAREVRFRRAQAAIDHAERNDYRAPGWAYDELWATCFYPADPQKGNVPPLGWADHERREA